ncbi:MAG: winged helix-turn-helix domain-containing protein [Candidatus Omnitrophota bacterium]
MKEKVIATCGKVWHELGFKGEGSGRELAWALNEDEEIVNMALGWLAREDKIRCQKKRGSYIFSLVQSEMEIFKGFYKDLGKAKRKNSFWKKLLS